MTILARKSGWMIGGKIVRETPKAHIFKPMDQKTEIRVPKDSETQKLVETLEDAQKFIGA